MTDYYPQHSTYDYHHHQQVIPTEHSGHTISYTGDPTEENGVHPSATHGSHHSHSQSHASVNASTRSWVYSNQMNPPPPPPVESVVSPGQTPFHGPRPLPGPHLHQYQLLQRPVQYDDVVEEEEEEGDYMDPNAPMLSGGVHFGYQREAGGVPARYAVAGPSSLTSAQSSPVPAPQVPRRNRSFVGGFFKGLKRIPRMFRGGGEKKRLVRQGTFGTEGTGTTLTTGNTLPRYLSNPSIGPTNPQFAHRLSQAVANGSLPPDVTSAAFQIRPPLVSPQQPVVTVTPPSDGGPEEEQQAEFFEGPPPSNEFAGAVEGLEHHAVDPRERTTVMVYAEAPTATQTRHISSAPISVHQSPRTGPRVSYPAELPTRASVQAQAESFYPPAPVAGPSTTPLASPPRHLRRQPVPPVIPAAQPAPKSTLSPPPTSAYSTMTTSTSCYDPSISSDLGPIEKFFKSLYNLPWISQGRVTIDYRPSDSPRAKGKLKSLTRPMSSWYHSIMSRSRRNSIDLLSSRSGTTSMGTSNILSSLTSPISRRPARSPNRHQHRSSKPRRHRSRRHHRATSGSTAGDPSAAATQRSASPIVPTVYPYTVPPYPPYTYPYIPYHPAVAMPPTGMDSPHSPSSTRSPRGPRAARSHRRKGSSSSVKYPFGGYTPYQPLAVQPPPPALQSFTSMPQAAGGMYYFTPSPPQSQNGDPGTNAAPVQVSPVLVHYVPAAYRQLDGGTATHMMVSPPTTPQKPIAGASNTSHKG
jgi:hypothetical protein